MSSFFAISSVRIPLGTDPDWTAANDYIDKLQWGEDGSLLPDTADDCGIYHSLLELDPDTNDMDEKLREAVRTEVRAFREATEESSDEISWLQFEGWKIWITAGRSFGDSPTEVMDVILSLDQMGVLEAAGFNHQGGRYDAVDFDPDCVKGRIACTRRDLQDELERVPDEVIRKVAQEELAGRDDIWALAIQIDASIAEKAIDRHLSS